MRHVFLEDKWAPPSKFFFRCIIIQGICVSYISLLSTVLCYRNLTLRSVSFTSLHFASYHFCRLTTTCRIIRPHFCYYSFLSVVISSYFKFFLDKMRNDNSIIILFTSDFCFFGDFPIISRGEQDGIFNLPSEGFLTNLF